MVTLLLVIIYISFISLGLPDALLGSAWPSMYRELQVPLSYAGLISMIISGGTIVSSLMSDRLIKKLGVGLLTTLSVAVTAAALLGFSTSHSYILLCLWAIPYGLGAGSVDAGLNNFVAMHYKARHMSWLHCFWGIGASLGPYIMGFCLTRQLGWNSGYRFIFFLQLILTIILAFSLPLWKTLSTKQGITQGSAKSLGFKALTRVSGAKFAMGAFFCYCGVETTTGLWGASYMVTAKGVAPSDAAKWVSFFYLGITLGRLLCGFVTLKVNSRNMVRLGQGIVLLGIFTFLLPLGNAIMSVGLTLIGLGLAPIYPCMLHCTPANFGSELSQPLMGMQMASASVGSTLLPPLVGFIISQVSMSLFPFFLLALLASMIFMSESLNKIKS